MIVMINHQVGISVNRITLLDWIVFNVFASLVVAPRKVLDFVIFL